VKHIQSSDFGTPKQADVVVEWQPIANFQPYARTPRKNDHAIDRMVDSLREYGFKIPILARNDGEVVDGHLRLKAASKLGFTQVPVILCDEWSDAQVKAFRLLVNRSASWADWDEDLLALELQDLKALDFDLDLTGFDPIEIDRFLVDDEPAEEELPVLLAEVRTQTGDVWLCGEHRVACGDATSERDVKSLLGSKLPMLMVTDPPYGVEYDPRWRERAGLGHQRQTGLVSNDHRADWSQAYKLFAGDVAYVWHAGVHAAEVAAGLEGAGFRVRGQIIWLKQHFALSRGDYHWKHEPCWYAVREGKPSHWNGDRTQSTVWEVPNLNPIGGSKDEAATGHSTQKPVEVMQRPILNNTRRGEIVYDPFLGSGTTLVAAESSGRFCYAMELDPRYVDLSVRRWQQLTGKVAVREADGLTFDETSEAEVVNAATEV
jgi:DNA modification methylase